METDFRSGFRVVIAFVVVVSLSGHLALVESRRPKNVQVALQAKWTGTPILLEAGYVPFLPLWYIDFVLFIIPYCIRFYVIL